MAVLLVYAFLIEPNRITIKVVPIKNNDLFYFLHDKKVVQISDLHITSKGYHEKKLIEKINKIAPDILFITGDLLVNGIHMDVCLEVLEQIEKPQDGIWIVFGNQDTYKGESSNQAIEEFVRKLGKIGITVLRGSQEQLKINSANKKLIIAGIEDPSTSRSKLNWILKDVSEDSAVILLSHYPNIFEDHADALIVSLGEADGMNTKGWSWQDNAFFEPDKGIIKFSNDGLHRLRVQRREAGVMIHKICLIREQDMKIIDNFPEGLSKIESRLHEMITINARDIPGSNIYGSWRKLNDKTAKNEIVIKDVESFNIEYKYPKLKPGNFFEFSFYAPSDVEYHIWVKMRAADEIVSGDSVFIQFDDSIDPEGNPAYRINELNSRHNLKKIDLILAGHTHGGQVRFPLIGSLKLINNQSFTYDMGLFEKNETLMYVNSGIGTSVLPIRFLCPPEITVFQFMRE